MARWPVATGVRLAATVASHGWVKLAPWTWDSGEGVLSRPEAIGGTTGTLAVRQIPAAIELTWGCSDKPDPAGTPSMPEAALEDQLQRRVRRWLCLDWDVAPFLDIAGVIDPQLAALVADGGGRLLRGSTFHEDFVKTLLTVNTNWASTCRMASALVTVIGHGVFPKPLDILDFGAERLSGTCRLGYRSLHLIAALEAMMGDGVLDAEGDADEAALTYDYLLRLRGIGPYAAAHLRMLLGDFSRLPVDTEMTAHLASLGLTPSTARQVLEPWGAWGLLALRLRRQLDRAAPGGPTRNP